MKEDIEKGIRLLFVAANIFEKRMIFVDLLSTF